MVVPRSKSAPGDPHSRRGRPLSQTEKRSTGRRPKTSAKPKAQAATPPQAEAGAFATVEAAEVWPYILDSWQRSILFLDTLRSRADNMIEHERAGLPPLLDFRYENILDARHFDRPANYALLRILEIGDDCREDCVDPDKPPVIVIDPRAGHGPGIGGFKQDSEVGMALHEGHEVYFVVFFPEPCPGQTLADVHHALRCFVAEVSSRHPGKPPVLYGNCQAGWAVTLLSADCQGLTGPAVLNGSPLSYWAGEPGTNPMRVAGGLSGGVWLAHFMSDLGDGRFDGAWLAQNFETLQPEKAVFGKYANLYLNIDTEAARFLEFERWWNGFYALSREEIVAISENLFIGNKLERGEFRICDGCVADLRRIRNPLVLFVSFGDAITPPWQALGWIPAVYKDTDDLIAAGQRIIYLTNPHVGHLGIFVSAKVARLEHRAILESLDDIEALAPGLYEMKIDNPSGDPDCHKPQFKVRFEPRDVKDLQTPTDNEAFEKVRDWSEINEVFYKTFVSPWVQIFSNPWTAEIAKQMHPMRTSRYISSPSFNPWMLGLSHVADAVQAVRQPLPHDHKLLEQERRTIDLTTQSLKAVRQARDAFTAGIYNSIFSQSDFSQPEPPARGKAAIFTPAK